MGSMNNVMPVAGVESDETLWREAREGDREAFGRIVERHQSLVCAVAYSACGNLARSEDLAQETFLAAWRSLGELREAGRLRAWLCGIARHLAANAWRRERRRGGEAAGLEEVEEPAAPGEDPAAAASSREEEALLWRALEGLPETQREPMVLFYRQGQSVAEVAAALEISEEAARQRLSRGRALLREGMAALVERTLTRTRPTAAFTVAVLMALPTAAASAAGATLAAGAGAAAGGGAAATGKGMLAKWGLGALAGPLIGLCCAYLGTGAAASTARSPQERALILRWTRRGILPFCMAMSLGLAAVLSQAGKWYTPSAVWIVAGVTLWTLALVGGILLACKRMDREIERIRVETNTTDAERDRELAAKGKRLTGPRHMESATRLLGLPLFAMAWGGHRSVERKGRVVRAWIAVGDTAISPFIAFGGLAVAPIAVGAVTVGVLSLSVFWGFAVGVFSLGSVAFGWWAVGCVAGGVRAAAGFAAVARDYALGPATRAAEGGTAAAKAWFKGEWLPEVAGLFVGQAHWWILGCAALALLLGRWGRGRGRA